jgi:hypothetical protein
MVKEINARNAPELRAEFLARLGYISQPPALDRAP